MFVRYTASSQSNFHHILAAEVVEALLRQQPAAESGRSKGESVDRAVRLVLSGNSSQREPMPAPNANAEEQRRILGEEWSNRRLNVLRRLQKFLGAPSSSQADLLRFLQVNRARKPR